MQYCLDSNTLIEAKNIHYGMDFCPAFWDIIEKETKTGRLFSISMVADELIKGNDELTEWAKVRKGGVFFIDTDDEDTQKAFVKIADYIWKNYSEEEASKFLDVADPWLIAKCMTSGATLVTKEVLAPHAKKVKIPNICKEFGIPYMQTHEVIRSLGAKFIL